LFDSSNPFSTSDEKPKPPPPRKPDNTDKRPGIPDKKPEIVSKKPAVEDRNVYSVPPSVPPPRATPRPQLNSHKSYPAPLPPKGRVKNLSLSRKQSQSSGEY
jgi:hypothetical protein